MPSEFTGLVSEILAPRDDIFIVEMQRIQTTQPHAYILGAYKTLSDAVSAADDEVTRRIGKYCYSVVRTKIGEDTPTIVAGRVVVEQAEKKPLIQIGEIYARE